MKSTDFLKKVSIFSDMSELERMAVADFLIPREYKQGEIICTEGEQSTELYIIRSGSVSMFSTLKDGTHREYKPLASGNIFGELSLVEGQERDKSATARTDTVILVLSGLDFYRMVWDYPMLGVKILKTLTRGLIENLEKANSFLDDMVRWGETARRRAVTDDLSGLFNRRFLEEAVQARFSRGFREQRTCSILMIDFDHFREINLTFGTPAGDAVIANAGATIERIVSGKGIPARLGGDEFAIFLPDSKLKDAEALAVVLQEEIAQLFLEFRTGPRAQPSRIKLTLSIGIASAPECGNTQADLFTAADRALYRAKTEGRNCVCRDIIEL